MGGDAVYRSEPARRQDEAVVDEALARRVRQFANQTERLLGMSNFDVSLSSRGCLMLLCIEIPPAVRSRGIGTDAMRRLCRFADTKGLRIELRPADRNHERLRRFYSRFDFMAMPMSMYMMVREPRANG